MICSASVYAILTGDDGINATTSGRIYPEQLPEQDRAYPAIVYDSDEPEVDQTYAGPSGLVREQVTIACLGTTYKTANDLASQVMGVLNALPRGIYGGYLIQGCFLQGANESVESLGTTAQDAMLYVKEVIYTVVFSM